jgi:hypothetical protein
VNFSNEFSRELVYQNLNVLRTLTLKSIFDKVGLSPNNTLLTVFGAGDSVQNHELFKNQYRPMKKGVTNMIRLHATGAIAMPIEIRLHILASSKDVIHS